MQNKQRVVVTGLGVISPVGNTVARTWEQILAGQSGVGPITRFDASSLPTQIAAEIKDFDVSKYMAPKEARKFDVFIHLGIAAAKQAQQDAGLEITEENADRIGVAIGSGIGGIETIEANTKKYLEHGARKISPFFIPSTIINMISGAYSIQSGARGPNFCAVSACTTGAHNVGFAARSIAYGDADVMIAGGAEMGTTLGSVGGFCSARALSRRNDDPKAASRPWDQDRDGFVLGEGAAVLVLESEAFAKARDAKIYAELSGFGMSGDAYHMTSPSEGGIGAQRCMQNALRDAGLNASDIDYINAHGTSTAAGDKGEHDAICAVFGDDAKNLAVSSTKSMTGHQLGAAGSIEAMFSVLAIRDGIAPPTINLDKPDEDFVLDFVPHESRQMNIRHVLSNSFGFGGTNGCLIFSQYT